MNKKASALLTTAWDLDQQALLRASSSAEAKALWQQAISICLELLKEFPRDINLLTKLATIYQHQQKFVKAKHYLDLADKYYPQNFLVAHNRGNLYRAMNQDDLAIKHYRLAVELSEGNELMKRSLDQCEKYIKDKKLGN